MIGVAIVVCCYPQTPVVVHTAGDDVWYGNNPGQKISASHGGMISYFLFGPFGSISRLDGTDLPFLRRQHIALASCSFPIIFATWLHSRETTRPRVSPRITYYLTDIDWRMKVGQQQTQSNLVSTSHTLLLYALYQLLISCGTVSYYLWSNIPMAPDGTENRKRAGEQKNNNLIYDGQPGLTSSLSRLII